MPPLARGPPWQGMQDALNSGWMSLVKVRPVLVEGGGNWLTSIAAAAENASPPPTKTVNNFPEILEMDFIRRTME